MGKLALKGGKPLRNKAFRKWPLFSDSEIEAVSELLRLGKVGRVTFFGKNEPSKVDELRESWLQYYPGKEYAIPCNSCCTALELALRNAGIGPGDEVITTPTTWVATNLAPLMVGADTTFADVSPKNYCLDPDALEAAVTPRTKAVIIVHVGGYCCEMDRIMKVAEKHNLIVIEDCAQAQNSKYKGRDVGTWGHFGCFSFDIAKLLTSGEGGMLVCDEKDLGPWVFGITGHEGKQINKIREKHKMHGWNYRMTEFQAAMVLSQLPKMHQEQERRQENAEYLRGRLREIEGIGEVPAEPVQNYYSFIFKYDSSFFKDVTKQKFMEALTAEGLPLFSSASHQEPAYRSPFFCWHGRNYADVNCPVAEKAFNEEAVGFNGAGILLGEEKDMDDIADIIIKVKENIEELI